MSLLENNALCSWLLQVPTAWRKSLTAATAVPILSPDATVALWVQWQGGPAALWVQHPRTVLSAAATKCTNSDSAITTHQHPQLGNLALRHQVWYGMPLGWECRRVPSLLTSAVPVPGFRVTRDECAGRRAGQPGPCHL